MLRRIGLAAVFAFLASTSCNPETVALSPRGAEVRVGKADPPVGARELGPIEVTHGGGCSAMSPTGTYEGALVLLRNEAGRRGATYVEIVTITEPHQEPRCNEQGYTIRGLAFRIDGSATAPSAAPSASTAPGCDPPCSPGYSCNAGACVALCNPPCSPGFTCAQSRTCEPVR